MKISRVEVRAVGPDVDKYSWSDDLPGQYMTNTLVRLVTDEGLEGVSGVWNATSYDFDRYTAEALRHLAPILIGRDPRDREAIIHDVRPRVWPLPGGALAAVEVALWDLAGKIEGQPIHALLGSVRDRIPAYASTPMLDDVPAYLRFIDELVGMGFRAVKLHTWCVPDRDIALAREVRRHHPDDEVAFMLDAENNYTRADSLAVARVLDELGFAWFEAPLPDHDYDGYRELTREVDIAIVPSGNWVQDLDTFEACLRTETWRTARTDVTMMGGISAAGQAMRIARSFGASCELFSWGYTLISAANLNVMFAHENCTYYEQPIPSPAFEYGMKDAIRADDKGYVHAPIKPGLGYEIDWEEMEAATVHRFEVEG